MESQRRKILDRIIFRAVFVLINLYAAFIIAYLILRILTTGHFWPIEIINVFIQWFLILGIMLIPVAIISKRRITIAMLAVCLVLFIGLYGDRFLPTVYSDELVGNEETDHFSVMTYNISRYPSVDDFADVIIQSNADIVGVQEFGDSQRLGLEGGLKKLYPYQVLYGSGLGGIGILSRYPIIEDKLFELEGRNPYLEARVQINDRAIRLLVIHPLIAFGPGGPEAPVRRDLRILTDMAVEEKPTIIMGDFNKTDQNEEYRFFIEKGLIDTYREVGWGMGHTYQRRTKSGKWPIALYRIDFILVTDDLVPIRSWVGEDGGSDHHPIITELSW